MFSSPADQRDDSDSLSSSFSECLTDEEIFGDSLPPSDVDMNDSELSEQSNPANEIEALEEEGRLRKTQYI